MEAGRRQTTMASAVVEGEGEEGHLLTRMALAAEGEERLLTRTASAVAAEEEEGRSTRAAGEAGEDRQHSAGVEQVLSSTVAREEARSRPGPSAAAEAVPEHGSAGRRGYHCFSGEEAAELGHDWA